LTNERLLKIIDHLLVSVPHGCVDEIRTELIFLGLDLIKKQKEDNYIFIALRNKKIAEIKKYAVRKKILNPCVYDEEVEYIPDMKDKATESEYKNLVNKYTILYVSFLRMTDTRKDLIRRILKKHWELTKKDTRNKISITDIIRNKDINIKTGFTMLKKIRKIIKESDIDKSEKIKNFNELYYKIVGKKINTDIRG
jgi:hypothetical protein